MARRSDTNKLRTTICRHCGNAICEGYDYRGGVSASNLSEDGGESKTLQRRCEDESTRGKGEDTSEEVRDEQSEARKELASMTVAQLRTVCKEAGVSQKGRKSELTEKIAKQQLEEEHRMAEEDEARRRRKQSERRPCFVGSWKLVDDEWI